MAESEMVAYVRELRDGNRLAALAVSGDEQVAVRAVFELSYRSLPEQVAGVFRLLGIMPGSDFTLEAVASSAGMSLEQARRCVDELVRANLLQQHRADRFQLHDLLLAFAADLVSAGGSTHVVESARKRLFEHYLYSASDAARFLPKQTSRVGLGASGPGVVAHKFSSQSSLDSWVNHERANILGLLQTVEGQERLPMWQLVDLIHPHLRLGGYMSEMRTAVELAFRVANRDDAAVGRALMAGALGLLHWRLCSWGEAIQYFASCVEACREAHMPQRELRAWNGMGAAYLASGKVDDARRCFGKSWEIASELGEVSEEIDALNNIGILESRMGRLGQSIANYQRVLELSRQCGSVRGQQGAYANLASTYRRMGRLMDALATATRARELQEVGYRSAEEIPDLITAQICVDLGQYARAATEARAALSAARAIGDRGFESAALNALAFIDDVEGKHSAAVTGYLVALSLAREIGDTFEQIQLLTRLAGAERRRGEVEIARRYVQSARGLCQESRLHLTHADVELESARTSLAAGHAASAIEDARVALHGAQKTGQRLAEGRAHHVLGVAFRSIRDDVRSEECLHSAAVIFEEIGVPELNEVRSLLAGRS
jgi:tetratricopeptide (TPR) repeat protein